MRRPVRDSTLRSPGRRMATLGYSPAAMTAHTSGVWRAWRLTAPTAARLWMTPVRTWEREVALGEGSATPTRSQGWEGRTRVSRTWLRMSSTAESVDADRKLALQKPQWRPDALAACGDNGAVGQGTQSAHTRALDGHQRATGGRTL